MVMSVQSLSTKQYGEEWYSPDFRILIEDAIVELRRTANNTFQPTAQEQAMFTGDFYGLLQRHNVENNLLWITMRVNGLDCTTDYAGEDIIVLIPDRTKLDMYMDVFQTQKSRLL